MHRTTFERTVLWGTITQSKNGKQKTCKVKRSIGHQLNQRSVLNKIHIHVNSDLVTIIFLHCSTFLRNNYDDENEVPGFDCLLGVVAPALVGAMDRL